MLNAFCSSLGALFPEGLYEKDKRHSECYSRGPADGQAAPKITMLRPHPPCSWGLASCDFQLLPKVIVTMKGAPFESIQDSKAARTAQLKTLRRGDSGAAAGSGGMLGGVVCSEVWGGAQGKDLSFQ